VIAAVPAGAAESSRCSKATADHVVKRLHIGYDPTPGAPSRIAQAICGPFAGPGSNAMAASIALPSCGGSVIWAVFRYRSGLWRLVMKRNNGASLSRAGTSDIRERQGVLRGDDAHCFPSAQRTRTWHWNGRALVPTAWEVSVSPSNPRSFLSPDRKTWCTLPADPPAFAYCHMLTPVRSATITAGGELTICDAAPCGEGWDSDAPVLRAATAVKRGGLRCAAAAQSITCTVIATGRGFTIGVAAVVPVGA
jgi:hypothetical protein